LPAGLPVARVCPRLALRARQPEGAGEQPRPRSRRSPTEGTTFVATEYGELVEVGCINAKHDFIIGEHMLGRLPEHATPGQPLGTVTLVGAGPGDPDLLTVAAYKALQAADVVVADRLVSQEILELVQGDLKVARKLPGCALEAQREIYRWCAEAVLAGKSVVRLKIGDPYVFGRGGEEVLEFRRLGVEPKVIPGISSALAAPLAAGIPVTHRGIANRVVFCTGMSKEETVPDVPPYHSEQTCVFLMAVGRLPELVEALTRDGYPGATPVCIIERATTPRERTLRSDLVNVVADASAAQVKAPAIIVVGGVVTALHDASAALMGNAVQDGDALMPEDMVAAVRQARAALALLESI
jgi:uroporphyrin-III C-methyltransferase